VTQVRLRPMTAEEYRDWLPWAIRDYAREDVEHKAVDPERARSNMAAFLESVIPRGPRTEGHRLSIVEDAETGERGPTASSTPARPRGSTTSISTNLTAEGGSAAA
jgi:hypothetical protein